jgi:probable HAF family extracellular repeat protein
MPPKKPAARHAQTPNKADFLANSAGSLPTLTTHSPAWKTYANTWKTYVAAWTTDANTWKTYAGTWKTYATAWKAHAGTWEIYATAWTIGASARERSRPSHSSLVHGVTRNIKTHTRTATGGPGRLRITTRVLAAAIVLPPISIVSIATGQECVSTTDAGIPPSALDLRFQGLSANGSVAIAVVGDVFGRDLAVRWTSASDIAYIGHLGGETSLAEAISADGSTIVGSSRIAQSGVSRAFRWTIAGGMQQLPGSGVVPRAAIHVSADGRAVTGIAEGMTRLRAFLWTDVGGTQDLGMLANYTSSRGLRVSSDGSTVVGDCMNDSGRQRAFRWTAGSGMQDLGTLGGVQSLPLDLSADGTVVVGIGTNLWGEEIAFRWTASGGMQPLGTLGGTRSQAFDISPDGAVIVGMASTATGHLRPFRWTLASGMTDLGSFGGTTGLARYVSDDGAVVVGQSADQSGRQRAFVWRDSLTSPISIAGLLGDAVCGLSADGATVIGGYRTADLQNRGFRLGPVICCDGIDFNNNTVFPEDQDVVDFLLVIAGVNCPACNDIDFNNNGVFPEDQDVIDFFNVLAGGTCP